MDKTITRLRSQIKTLQSQLDRALVKRRAIEVQQIVQIMHQHSLTPEDIQQALKSAQKTGRRTTPARIHDVSKRAPVAPKYRNQATGDTWSGRGKPPRWLSAAERAGTSREAFLITP
ncbi:H-NS histone family protein (plasmid) [Achromobacter sp. CF-sbj1-Ac2-l]|uniref:H-NS histone family protein n=1 Tax=Achromobacter TaxID=222 RepID=UPI0006C67F96|nr:H-NS histone family protein [Achromobacter xylosoxidans]CUJ63887.1 H-NS histone family [Achromobacter xylosoxidans]